MSGLALKSVFGRSKVSVSAADRFTRGRTVGKWATGLTILAIAASGCGVTQSSVNAARPEAAVPQMSSNAQDVPATVAGAEFDDTMPPNAEAKDTETDSDDVIEISTSPTSAVANPTLTNTDAANTDAEPNASTSDLTVAITDQGAVKPQPDPALLPVGPEDGGPRVLALQQHLSDLGFAPGAIDGDYGRRTVRAVEAFQSLVGLEVTGTANRLTTDALLNFDYDGTVLKAGDEGTEVEQLQRLLAEGPFDPGPVDGVYGTATRQSVWALEKLSGVPVDGDWGPLDQAAWDNLQSGTAGQPQKQHANRWVEVDISEQLMKVYDPGSTTPTLISHISSGSGRAWENEEHSGSSITPMGSFSIKRRINGWRESSLNIGRLYNPLYFTGGIAFHGAMSVPLYPASHGCIRVPMHIAEYLPGELPNGTPVHVLP